MQIASFPSAVMDNEELEDPDFVDFSEQEDDEEQVYKETAILPADAEIFTASPEFTQLAVEAENAAIGGTIEGAELKVEVIAKEESGNSTITEIGVFEYSEENGE